MSTVLGSAAWSTDPGHWRYTPIGNAGSADGRAFSAARRIPERPWQFACPPSDLQHMLSIAPTRSGKGVSLIVPNLLDVPGSRPRRRSERRKRPGSRPRAAATCSARKLTSSIPGTKSIASTDLRPGHRKQSRISIRSRLSIPSPTSMSMIWPTSRTPSSSAEGSEGPALGRQRPRAGGRPDGVRGRESRVQGARVARVGARWLLSLLGGGNCACAIKAAQDATGAGSIARTQARALRNGGHRRDQFGIMSTAQTQTGIFSTARRSVAEYGGLGFQIRGSLPGERLDLSGLCRSISWKPTRGG